MKDMKIINKNLEEGKQYIIIENIITSFILSIPIPFIIKINKIIKNQ